jgi:hypothetical protein
MGRFIVDLASPIAVRYPRRHIKINFLNQEAEFLAFS